MAQTPGTPLAPGNRRRSDATGSRRSNGSGQARILLDDISKQIIEQLQQDGRRSYASIGQAVGLSEAAVRQRVQRLVEARAVEVAGGLRAPGAARAPRGRAGGGGGGGR